MIKSLSELSLNISEELYREIPCLSYSSIAKYEKNGFSVIPHLFDTQESDTLLFGSVVDTLITEGIGRFNEKFAIADFAMPTDSIKKVIDALFEIMLRDDVKDTNLITDEMILEACNTVGYNTRLRDDTRVAKVREEGIAYANAWLISKDRTIIPSEMYQDALATVSALKNHPLIGKYLGTTNHNTEFLYQQKFKTTLEGLEVKGMMDLLIVIHDSKTIIPVDLKTSSFPEYDFPKRYLENRYDIQSRLYYRILKDIISKDEYFKDFNIATFKFIVVNKNSRNPLIFIDEKCKENDDILLTFNSGRTWLLRDPITIGKELQEYLDNPRLVPNGIELNQSNNIYERLKLL